ncbi:M1 family metallopeptidase [Thioalkalivibrio sp. ALE9]|uniref:M1 family metallopeptidase n=1 Tax=Thioalkalivibrio sp. ALE9 TaxID=1158169 RepID=UPI00036B821B|nr:M1 family peptidase [Thioalkalivibrio sp. ALE9]
MRTGLLAGVIIAVGLLLAPLPGAASVAGVVVVQVELDPGQSRLEGRYEADPAQVDPATLRRFRLDPGIAVDAVSLGGHPVEFERSGDGWLELARAPEADAGALVIRYGARLPALDDARPGSGFLAPEGGYLPAGADWYPRRPEQEPHAVRIEVTSLGGHRAVASGSQVAEEREGDRYRTTFEHPAGRALAVATGPWDAVEQEVGTVTVRTLFPAHLEAEFGATYREQAAGYIERFSEAIGPYPYDTFTIAASPRPVGLAFPGFTLMGERVIPLPFIPHTSLGHEVLHAWWGTGVYVDASGGNWSEGLTTFMADYQFKRDRGEGREERGQWLRDYAALPSGQDRPHGSFRGGNSGAARIAGYHRGAMLWRMLEDRIGEEALRAGVRELYAEWLFREADWAAVSEAFDRETEEDLRPFFEQWIERTGAPTLELVALRLEPRGNGWQVTGQLRQADDDDPWHLRVPLVLKTEEGRETHWIELESVSRPVSIETDRRPRAIAVDPDWRLFRHLADGESPEILRQGALDPEARVFALGDAGAAEVAPWLGRVPEVAEGMGGTRILLGTHAAVAEWLDARGPAPEPAAVEPGLETGTSARAWTVPGTQLVVISGPDSEARRSAAAALRHRSHYSYLLGTAHGDWETGLWSQPGIWQELANDD